MRIKKGWKITFWIIGLYIIYFIVGIILVETHVLKKWYFAPNAIITDTGGAHHGNATAGVGGPHVFYIDSTIVLKSVIKNDTGHTGKIDTFLNRDSIVISCHFEEYPEWDFDTQIKSQLVNEPSIYIQPDSLIAISDIEGEFGAFRKLLIANGVVNEQYRWTFGTGHLVLVGDFFDRGLQVTETLWLIYHLEGEARKAGGKVHFVLGNHDVMNMQEDIRYVSSKYLENAKLIATDYQQWYKPNTELGRWLQTKNIVEQIGGIIFVHGGISDAVNDMSLSIQELNEKCRPYYFTNKSQYNSVNNKTASMLMWGHSSPLWYRGYAEGKATQQQVNKTLMLYGATTIVVGHTIVDEVSTFYDGRVIDVDTKHSKGVSQGLFYSAGKYYIIDKSGNRIVLK